VPFLFRLLLVSLLLTAGAGAAYGQEAKYIVLLIADGWGPKHIEATNSYTGVVPVYESGAAWVKRWTSTFPRGGSYDSTLAWNDFEYVLEGATDSAAASSALSSGRKTEIRRVSVSYDGTERFFTIGEIAKSLDKGVGAVTSIGISSATPAGFLSHNDDRGNRFAISDELLFGNPNTTGTVATDPKYGGGHGNTFPTVDVIIGDGRNTYVNSAMWTKLATESGQPGKHVLVRRQTGVDGGDALWAAANDPNVFKVAGLFDHIYRHDPSYSSENPSLAESARAALRVLEKNGKGFVLMIEGGAVDWASHSNNMDLMIGEMIDFDEAVQAVVDWVEDAGNDSDWSNTLVIVTGDHECGYLTAGPGIYQNQPLGAVSGYTLGLEKIVLNGGGLRASWNDSNNDNVIDSGEVVYWAWNSGGHTNTLAPLYARGAGAELFADYAVSSDPVRGPYLDNSDVFNVMEQVIRPSSGGSTFSDDFSTNSIGEYTVLHTWTKGGVGTLRYNSAGKRARVLTGDDVGLQFSHGLPCAETGYFSIDFLPTKKYPSAGWLYIRLVQDANNYYEIENTDGYGARGIRKIVNGLEVDEAGFSNGYAQKTNYTISIDFSPTQTVVDAFGNLLTLNTDTREIRVCGFEIEVEQQDAYFDNIYYEGDSKQLFIAYNDLGWQTGQLSNRITTYTTGASGFLKDYSTGSDTGVRLAISGGYVGGTTVSQGGNASSGTDANGVFNGIVDSVGLISYSATNLIFTFTGLDPTLRYEVVLFGNRNNTSYAGRTTTTTLSDVVGFTNASTPGAIFQGRAMRL
jgi:alkaline phosphatase